MAAIANTGIITANVASIVSINFANTSLGLLQANSSRTIITANLANTLFASYTVLASVPSFITPTAAPPRKEHWI